MLKNVSKTQKTTTERAESKLQSLSRVLSDCEGKEGFSNFFVSKDSLPIFRLKTRQSSDKKLRLRSYSLLVASPTALLFYSILKSKIYFPIPKQNNHVPRLYPCIAFQIDPIPHYHISCGKEYVSMCFVYLSHEYVTTEAGFDARVFLEEADGQVHHFFRVRKVCYYRTSEIKRMLTVLWTSYSITPIILQVCR
jgi:hypothetical protein